MESPAAHTLLKSPPSLVHVRGSLFQSTGEFVIWRQTFHSQAGPSAGPPHVRVCCSSQLTWRHVSCSVQEVIAIPKTVVPIIMIIVIIIIIIIIIIIMARSRCFLSLMASFVPETFYLASDLNGFRDFTSTSIQRDISQDIVTSLQEAGTLFRPQKLYEKACSICPAEQKKRIWKAMISLVGDLSRLSLQPTPNVPFSPAECSPERGATERQRRTTLSMTSPHHARCLPPEEELGCCALVHTSSDLCSGIYLSV